MTRNNQPRGPIGMPPRLNPKAEFANRLQGWGNTAGDFLQRKTSIAGRSFSYGRGAAVGGLGLLALRNTANTIDRVRYGDYGGAMMSAAVGTAAAAGAYRVAMHKGALRSHFNNALSRVVGWAGR